LSPPLTPEPELDIADRFADASVQKSAAVDLAVIDALDEQIGALELYLRL
jgi:hypothetical protein